MMKHTLIRTLIWLCLATSGFMPGMLPADTITNTAIGSTQGYDLDTSNATVLLNRANRVVESATAEISPNRVDVSSIGQRFIYNILPTITAENAGIRQIRINVPAGYTGIAPEGIQLDGNDQLQKDNPPGEGEYAVSVSGNVITFTLGGIIVKSPTSIEITFSVDVPETTGVSDFTSSVDNYDLTSLTVPGDANGSQSDSNSTTVRVVNAKGAILDLKKESNKKSALVGEVVTYRVEIRNTTDIEAIDVLAQDHMPANFKYLEGSALLSGEPTADPGGVRPLQFAIDSIPAFADGNGNGKADPGEPGYMVLSYQAVIGSGVTPGIHANSIVVTDDCDSCFISNVAKTEVAVTIDPDFELSTIIGKVFEDENANGKQDENEFGVPGVMVALDNGTYALTDDYGRYHFPLVRPGHRMVKINLNSLSSTAVVTTGESEILWVSPGLMAKANFGVTTQSETVEIGAPPVYGATLDVEIERKPIDIVGSAETFATLVNGEPVAVPSSSVKLLPDAQHEKVRVTGSSLDRPAEFQTSVAPADRGREWTLTALDSSGEQIYTTKGEGAPPDILEWDGITNRGRIVTPGQVYQYQLEARFNEGSAATSPRHSFGVDREAAMVLILAGDVFTSDQLTLTTSSREALDRAAAVMREYPNEKFVVDGHTDSQGSQEYNMALSKKGAEKAAEYLTHVMHVPVTQLIVRWSGEESPIASNNFPEGRALNSRIEIRSEVGDEERADVLDQFRTDRRAKINGIDMVVDPSGRFDAVIDDPSVDRLDVELADSRGRTARTTIPLPLVEIAVPHNADVTPLPVDGTITCRVEGKTEPGNIAVLDGHEIDVEKDGTFTARVSLGTGHNPFGLLATNPEGFSRVANVDVIVSDRDENGHLLEAQPAVPYLSINLPAQGLRLRSKTLRLSGETEPGNQVLVNGESMEVKKDGTFKGSIDLPRGESTLTAEVIDADGNAGTIERDVVVADSELFLMAFADGKFGQLRGKGYLEGTGLDEETKYYTEGRFAFYLKGFIAGKYLITSAYDSDKDDYETTLGSFDTGSDRRLLRNLDPEKLYPVYGDQSTVVYDGQSQGKFYLALESDELNVLFGNYPLDLSDTELAAYRRTLYGGQVVYQSGSRTQHGAPDTRIALFGAEVRQFHARDEVRATGGSLYYLSHASIIEGSEQILLVVRDKNTGLTLSRTTQRQNIDYTIKYEEGRLMFRRPIASVSSDDALVDQEILAGNPVYIQIDYETSTNFFEKKTFGARARKQLGERIAIGGTYVDDNPETGPYELKAMDAELLIGNNSRVTIEYAESEGADSPTFISDDGGLTYKEVTPDGPQRGEAWKAAVELDVGEVIGKPNRLGVRAYAKELGTGFFSGGTSMERGTRKVGVSANLDLTQRSSLLVSRDHETYPGDVPPGAAKEMTTESARFTHQKDRWGLDFEYFSNESEDEDGRSILRSQLGAARLRSEVSEKLSGRFEYQQTLAGSGNDQTTLGFQYQARPSLAFDIAGTDGSRGRSAQAGAVLTAGQVHLYLTERVAETGSGDKTSTVFGGESRIGKSNRVYTEYQWDRSASENRAVSLIGAQREWEARPGLRLLLSAETAKIRAASTESDRHTIAGGAVYKKPKSLTASSRNEVRYETGSGRKVQYFTVNQVDITVTPDLSLLARHYYSLTKDRDTGTHDAELDERSLGIAFRPVTDDRFNLLARYTTLSDQRPRGIAETAPPRKSTDVVSMEGIVELTNRLELTLKGAARIQDEKTVDRPPVRTHTYLTVQRMNISTWSRLGVGLEHRLLNQREANDYLTGWLSEMTWDFADYLRLGAGYNFTDFSDDEFIMNDYSVHGWFLRMQGRY